MNQQQRKQVSSEIAVAVERIIQEHVGDLKNDSQYYRATAWANDGVRMAMKRLDPLMRKKTPTPPN